MLGAWGWRTAESEDLGTRGRRKTIRLMMCMIQERCKICLNLELQYCRDNRARIQGCLVVFFFRYQIRKVPYHSPSEHVRVCATMHGHAVRSRKVNSIEFHECRAGLFWGNLMLLLAGLNALLRFQLQLELDQLTGGSSKPIGEDKKQITSLRLRTPIRNAITLGYKFSPIERGRSSEIPK
jgi:hypothetical protein